MGHSVEDFFEALKEESDGGRALPNWYVPHFLPALWFMEPFCERVLTTVERLDVGMGSYTLR